MTLDELRKLDQAATAGDWFHFANSHSVIAASDDGVGTFRANADAALIVAMRNNIGALLDLVSAADELIENRFEVCDPIDAEALHAYRAARARLAGDKEK